MKTKFLYQGMIAFRIGAPQNYIKDRAKFHLIGLLVNEIGSMLE